MTLVCFQNLKFAIRCPEREANPASGPRRCRAPRRTPDRPLRAPPGRARAGALIVGPRAKLNRRQWGGGQERGLRSGTENVSGIAGFGAAAVTAQRDIPSADRQAPWRDHAAEQLKAEPPDARVGE